MPNFTVGGVDAVVEPSFTGFQAKARDELREQERRLPTADVEFEPKLVTGFQRKLQALVDRATSRIRVDIEANPELAKGFQRELKEKLAKATASVKIDVEARPKLATGFQRELRAEVERASSRVRIEIPVTAKFEKGTARKVQAEARQAGTKIELPVRAVAGKALTADIARITKEVSKTTTIDIPIRAVLPKGGLGPKVNTIVETFTSGITIDVPIRGVIRDPAAFAQRINTIVETFSEGITIDVPIRPVLSPTFYAQTAAVIRAAEAQSRLSFRIRGDSDGLAADLRTKLGEAAKLGGRSVVSSLSVVEATIGRVLHLARNAAIGFGILSAAILAVGAAGVKSAADFEYQRQAFQLLLEDVSTGNEVFEGLLKLSKETVFEVPNLAPLTRQLIVIRNTLGEDVFGVDRVLPSVETVTDLGAALDLTGPQIERIGLALGKIAGRGKVTSEELRSITKNAPGFSAIGAIADELGVSIPEAFKKVTAGEVDALTGIEAILAGMKEFPGAAGAGAKEAQETFKGALTNLPDIARIAFFDAFEGELPELTRIIGPNGPLVKAMESALPVVAKAFTPLAAGLLDTFQLLLPGIENIVDASLPLILGLVNAAGELAPAFAILANLLVVVLDPLADAMERIGSTLNDRILKGIAGSRNDFRALGEGVRDLVSGLADAVGLLAPLLPLLAQFGGALLGGIGRLAATFAEQLEPALADVIPVATELIGVIEGILAGLAPLLPVLGKVVKAIGEALVDALERVDVDSLVEAVGGLAVAAGDVLIALAPLLPALVSIATTIASSLTPVVEAFAPLLAGTLTLLIPLVQALANLAPLVAIGLAVVKVIGYFKALALMVGSTLDLFNSMESRVVGIFDRLGQGIGEKVWSGMLTAAAAAGAGIAGYMAGAAEDSIGSLTSIGAAAGAVFLGFQQGGPVGGAIAAAAAVIGFFFGQAAKKAREAKEAQEAYNAEVVGLRDAFAEADVTKFSSDQAKAVAIGKNFSDQLADTTDKTLDLRTGFKELDPDFQVLVTALSRGERGTRAFQDELDRVVANRADIISERSLKGVQDYGIYTDAVTESLRELSIEYGSKFSNTQEAASSAFERGSTSLLDLLDAFDTYGVQIDSTSEAQERFNALLQENIADSPYYQALATLPEKTRDALAEQTRLAEVQAIAAREQEKQSGGANRFASAYDEVSDSLNRANDAYSRWLDLQRGATIDMADLALSTIDYVKQLRDVAAATDLTDYEKQQRRLQLVADAQDRVGEAVARFVDESGGNYDTFTEKVGVLRLQLADGLVQSLGISTEEAGRLVDEILKLPTEQEFSILADTQPAITSLEDLQERLASYILSNPSTKAWLDRSNATDQVTIINALLDDYAKSNPEAKAYLDSLDVEAKKKLVDALLADIDGSTATARIIIREQLIRESDQRQAEIREGRGNISKGFATLLELQKQGKLPVNARGSIVRNPLVTLVGEAGPEAILPLTDPARMAELIEQLGIDQQSAAAMAAALAGRGAPAVPTVGAGGRITSGAAQAATEKVTERVSGFVDTTAQTLAPLGTELDKATKPGLDTWSTSVDNQAKGITDSFVTMGDNNVRAVQDSGFRMNQAVVATGAALTANASAGAQSAVNAMVAELSAGTTKVQGVVADYGKSLSDGINPILSAVGAKTIPVPVVKRAEGGPIPGPRVRRDIVPALLMPGEFVVRRDAVDRYGLAAMHALNQGRVPRFRDGGQVTGDIEGLNPTFFNRLSLWSSAEGQPFHVRSGFRTYNEQVAAYQRMLAGIGAKAAIPGSSMHEYGLAVDGPHWGGRGPGRFGIRYPMSFEPWHAEPVEARAWRALARDGKVGGGGLVAGIGALPKPPAVAATGAIAQVATAVMARAYEAALAWAGTQTITNAGAASGALADFPVQVQKVLATIRAIESGGNYLAQNPYSSAFGAYQFIASTWVALARRFGLNPANRSPAAQDTLAARYVQSILAQYGGDVRAVPSVWYVGSYNPRGGDYVPAGRGNTLSVNAYIAKWLRRYVQGYENGGLVSTEDVVRVAERNRPELIVPLTNPTRAKALSDQYGLTDLVSDGKQVVLGERSIVVEVTPPDADSPEAYGASIANRVMPVILDAVLAATGG